jgi:hypothetical protein
MAGHLNNTTYILQLQFESFNLNGSNALSGKREYIERRPDDLNHSTYILNANGNIAAFSLDSQGTFPW